MSSFYGARIGAAEVAITAGCNLAFAMALAAVAGEGEAVLLPTPWYFNHQMAMTMAGVRPVPVPTRAEHGFGPEPARIATLLVEHRARAVVLVTPNNPTGAVYPPEVIQAVATACRAHGAMLLLDETYRDFLADGRPHGLFDDPAWGESVIHLYSFSKAYCVPGHRLGALAAGAAVMTELEKALDTLQICPPRPTQQAIAWAIPATRAWREGNRALMAARAAFFRDAMNRAQGWRLDALGTYFAYLRVPEGAPDAVALAEWLAGERGLMCLPGPFFGPGQERHLRLAFANAAEDVLAEVPERLRGPLRNG
jgi:aspartate/methionine/tyrosine aminotransferase